MINVVKRNGEKEPLDISKFHRVAAFACDGLSGVSSSELELKTQIQFFNNIKTTEIQETLIKAAADLISEDAPNYQYVAGRLINYHIRKDLFNGDAIPKLYDHYKKVVGLGYYDKSLDKSFSAQEWETINGFIDHERDMNITFAGMEQFRGKYLVKNRVTNTIFETPQFAFIMIAVSIFRNYPEDTRLKYIKHLYDALSTFQISFPTPIMAGVRTPQKQFSSCVLIECDDSLDSINATTSAIVKYVSSRAGIGVNIGRIRAENSPIRNGDAYHTGVTPFARLFQSATKSCSQGSVRDGAATLYFPMWHLEYENLIVLRNNKGIPDNRVNHVDYAVQVNKLMYERLIYGENITLFSPHDVPDLYEAFFVDNDKFKELYEKYERSRIRKKTLTANEVWEMFIRERKETGRIYLMNVDHANDHGSFVKEVAPIRQSNLCLEIDLPTKPLNDINDEEGEIALCTLAAINFGKINETSDLELPCDLVVRALNEILDMQDYPVPAARAATMDRRPLGVGIMNLAYWLAKNDLDYQNIQTNKEGMQKIHRFAEAWSYYLIKASVNVAKERKKSFPKFNETKYSQVMLPIDTYKKTVDELVEPNYAMNWDALREDILAYGMMNSTLMAGMPTETSSQTANGTAGFDPIRHIISYKQSKDGTLKQVAPESRKLKNKYDLMFDQKSPRGYMTICAIFQKFMDQGISVNTSYNPTHHENNELSLTMLLEDVIFFYRYGGKQLYYFNTADGAGELSSQEDCDSCKV